MAHEKSSLQVAGKHDKLTLNDYNNAIMGDKGLEAFRRKVRHGNYTFKIHDHRIVAVEGNAKLHGNL